jgi:hypothetical protein
MAGFSSNYKKNVPNVVWNDWYLDRFGNIATTDGVDEIEETCAHAVQLTQGDYIFNVTNGIPWDVYLQSNSPVGNQIQKSIIETIMAVNGVRNITSFAMAINKNRNLEIDVVVNLTNNTQISVTQEF